MEKYTGFEIAVIGLAGRFPQAENISEYWTILKNGVNCIQDLSDVELLEAGESEASLQHPQYVRSSSFLKEKKYFDAEFFGYRPDEAELMDPQLRIFHEVCWEALEDSGYSRLAHKDKIGLFASGSPNINWELYALLKNTDGRVDEFTAQHLRSVAFLSSRVSYKLDLKGPVVFLQTACSSSLTAIHLACHSLLTGECAMALAGGIRINNQSKRGYVFTEGMILSKTGRCRPFDISSDGTVGGEGSGVVVLKKLKDAIRDRDNIYAVIKGTGVNNDGSQKVGFTAPSVHGQAEAIRRAYKMAGITPESIGYIEAHGTATELGDPIEIAALNDVFGKGETGSCAIGSVKSNIGHLDAAAGVAGFIKTVLSLKHKQLPPSLHFSAPNPRIDFENGPFFVNTSLTDWKNTHGLLRAGVSAFGVGGTNVHVVLEEAPALEGSAPGRRFQLIVLSAMTEKALARNTARLTEYLKGSEGVELPDIAFTLQTGRVRFKYRKAFVCEHKDEAVRTLSSGETTGHVARSTYEDLQHTVFMFSGQGSQYVNMGRDLYRSEQKFKEKVDACFEIARQYSGENFYGILFPDTEEGAGTLINHTRYAQPLLFIIEYSLASLLMEWGVRPQYMIGHSIGEYVAACLSEVFTLEEALRLVIRRGELMGQVKPGVMLAVETDENGIRPFLLTHKNISLSVINSDTSVVVAGESYDVAEFEKVLTGNGYATKKLHTSHAFHSHMMDGILHRFEQEFEGVDIRQPKIPYVSNVDGELVTHDRISKPSYWSRQLRSPVQFYKGTELLLKQGNAIFVEVGPGRALCNHVLRSIHHPGHQVVNTIRQVNQEVNDHKYLIEKAGHLWMNGITINWDNFYRREKRKKVSLPTYSFEKVSYTADVDVRKLLLDEGFQRGALSHEGEIRRYIHVSSWKKSISPNPVGLSDNEGDFLVFLDKERCGRFITAGLEALGQNVVEVQFGESFKIVHSKLLEANPERLDLVWQHLEKSGVRVTSIIYASALNETPLPTAYDHLDERLKDTYIGLACLAKSIARAKQHEKLSITVVTNNLASVTAADEADPVKATLLGPAKIMPSELLNVNCKVVDLPYPFSTSDELNHYVSLLMNELSYQQEEPFVAYRYRERWTPTFDPFLEHERITSNVDIISGGVYLIAGGFGGMGFSIAANLVEEHGANVVLIHRSPFPGRQEWDHWLSAHDEKDPVSVRIMKITEMERTGRTVDLYQANLSNEAEIRDLCQALDKKYPAIHGLIWAAGEVDYGGIIQQREYKDLVNAISSKVHGLLLFEKYMQLEKLDFVALFSSIGNVFYQHKFGQVGYNASNEFLESYSYYLRKKTGVHAFTINWSDWLNVGMTFNVKMRETGSTDVQLINAKIPDGLSPAEGMRIFHSCLQSKAPATTIFKGDISEGIRQSRLAFNRLRQGLETHTDLSGQPDNHGSSPEEKLIGIFSRFFGKVVRATDDFFELGGDSLQGMTLVARINQEMGVKLSIADLYKHPTPQQILNEVEGALPTVAYTRVPVAPSAAHYVLSSNQKRMYFLQSSEKESTAYNEVKALEVTGALDRKRLYDTFVSLIARHEALRTSFVFENGTPRQIINKEVPFVLQALPYHENGLQQTMQAFIQPFDLECAPLFRVGLIERGAQDHVILIDVHHIVTDGISQRILFDDFMALYNNETLPEVALQYKDFAVWQQSKESQAVIADQRAFWLNEFAGEIPTLDLPAGFPVAPSKDVAGAGSERFTIGESEMASLRSIAAVEDVSLYMTVLSAYVILLSKLANVEDLVVGTTTAGRKRPELEKVMGMFVNTLPLRFFPAGNLTYREFLKALKHKVLACFDNQAYQYEQLIDELHIAREGRNPLFDVAFVFNNFKENEPRLAGVTLKELYVGRKASKFDLMLSVSASGDNYLFDFEYSAALFSRDTIARFIDYFKRIIASIISDPDATLSGIAMQPQEDVQRLVYGFNNTETIYPPAETVIGLFAEQVRRKPSATALIENEVFTTYEELDVLSGKVAAYLRQVRGVSVGDVVVMVLPRGKHLVAAILGIMKAGAAYIPVDVNTPGTRVSSMINDSKPALIVTKGKYFKTDPPFADKVLDLDDALPAILERQPMPRDRRVTSNLLAYVIYTSGSTGNPKGVMIRHQSLLNYVAWASGQYVRGEKATFAFFTSIAFDLTVTSIFTPLVTGNAIAIYGEMTADVLMESVASDGVSDVLKLTPTHLKLIRDSVRNVSSAQCVKKFIVGGEDLTSQLAKDIYEKFSGQVEIYNEYGPTEATVGAMIYRFNPADPESSVPIGVPIANTQIYLLDKYLNPVAPGVTGELYISGDGLATGYLSDDQLTAQRFIGNPFITGKKMYRTGDLASLGKDGKLVFRGRADEQVKIRGFRVELGEIESQLALHEKIRSVAVHAREKQGDKYLVAYYVSDHALEPSVFKEFLFERLPDYMIPNFYVHLKSLPLTNNGKLDRKNLPDPEMRPSGGNDGSSNETEAKLVEIWAEVLKLDKGAIGVNSSFFELGGHSIGLVYLLIRIQQAFFIEMKIGDIFEHASIRKLAQLVSKLKKGQVTRIPSAGIRDSYPASPAQKRMYYQHLLHQESKVFNVSISLEIKGRIDMDRITKSFQKLVDRHEALRTSLILSDEGIIQKISNGFTFALEILDPGKADTVHAAFEAFIRPIDLSSDSLLRAGLLRHKRGNYLFLDIHHIVFDALSTNILVNDFKKIYMGEELAPLEVRYVDYAAWVSDTKGQLAKQRDFWLEKLSGKLPRIDLPVSGKRAGIDISKASAIELVIDEKMYREIRKFTASSDVSEFMFFLSVYYILLAKISGNSDIIIGTESVGRTLPALKDTIGLFINVLPLRVQVDAETEYGKFLGTVKDCVLQAFDRQDFQFDDMVSLIGKEEDVSRNPIFDAYFSFSHSENKTVSLGETELVPMDIKRRSKGEYELAINAAERDGKMKLEFVYRSELYDRETIDLLVAYYHTILVEILKNDGLRIKDIALEHALEKAALEAGTA